MRDHVAERQWHQPLAEYHEPVVPQPVAVRLGHDQRRHTNLHIDSYTQTNYNTDPNSCDGWRELSGELHGESVVWRFHGEYYYYEHQYHNEQRLDTEIRLPW
ncbi:hypothetical protein KSF_100990 [Reticulibacter mediterranei]|uniref:Uncharacterized protein n=1 Tax=Reticulibacter mediterranei TaxID=2778369 RepID=A0A8J3J1T7_9CHLR|nr:hypothetical protein KSF_100990 [Reticulibacter mediterranei]